MTESERRMARALGCCIFLPGTATKRFAKSMALWAQAEDDGAESRDITPKQRKYLLDAVYRFRRQISPAIVAEAVEQAKLMESD